MNARTNNAKHLPEREIIESFRAAMAENGLDTDDDVQPTNGEIARFHVKGDAPRSKNGWYVLFIDGHLPAGEFGSWKSGQTITWTARDTRHLSQDEQREVRARLDEARRQRDAARREREGEAARTANLLWNDAPDATDEHPYLVRKSVPAYGLRIGRWPVRNREGVIFRHIENTLLVPMMDKNGRIVSLQGIFPGRDEHMGRDKDFWRGGRMQGAFYMIGRPQPGGTIAVCEGYSTGATVHQATGWAVVVAFNANNLTAAAKAAREMMPDYTFVIAADNDQWTTEPVENPGVVFAQQAAGEINARVIVPEFTDTSTRPTDWNDLQAIAGLEETQRQLLAHETPPAPANDNTPPATMDVDTFTPLPDSGGKGKPLATIENLYEICRRLGVVVRYNVISKEEEILIPGHTFSVDNAANASLAWLNSWCERFRMPTGKLGDYVTFLADQNQYNPVANWILSRPWDGTPRLQALCDTVTPRQDIRLDDGRSLRDVLITRWMLSAVAAAFQPNGVSAHGILVLQGEQYLGKTKWFKNLVPEELGVLKDGMILRPDDKDSVKQVCSFWLVELGELDATFRKSDIAQLKSFITNSSDVLRRAYARKESHFARRTVFFGSVNPREYLHDPTGNRRYWTIEAENLDLNHGLDMQQVWAEVYALWKDGEGFYLTPEEMAALNNHNEGFTVVDPIQEMLQTRLDWTAPEAEWEWRTATETLVLIGYREPKQSDATKAATFIRKMNGKQHRRYGGKSQLLVPPRPMGMSGDYDRPF